MPQNVSGAAGDFAGIKMAVDETLQLDLSACGALLLGAGLRDDFHYACVWCVQQCTYILDSSSCEGLGMH